MFPRESHNITTLESSIFPQNRAISRFHDPWAHRGVTFRRTIGHLGEQLPQTRPSQESACEGVVFRQASLGGDCWLRRRLDIEACVRRPQMPGAPQWESYVKATRTIETSTAVSAAPLHVFYLYTVSDVQSKQPEGDFNAGDVHVVVSQLAFGAHMQNASIHRFKVLSIAVSEQHPSAEESRVPPTVGNQKAIWRAPTSDNVWPIPGLGRFVLLSTTLLVGIYFSYSRGQRVQWRFVHSQALSQQPRLSGDLEDQHRTPDSRCLLSQVTLRSTSPLRVGQGLGGSLLLWSSRNAQR